MVIRDFKKFNVFDLCWMVFLFGMVVGVGILFLFIRVGGYGIWVIVVMSVIIFFLIYLGYRVLVYFIGFKDKEDIIMVVCFYFGV